MKSRLGESRRDERGQAIAELVLVVGIMLVLALSLFDLGRAAFAYVAIISGARDGARVAMDTGATDTDVRNAALSAAAPYVPSVAITRTASGATVVLTYQYQPISPFLQLIGQNGNLQLSARMVSQ